MEIRTTPPPPYDVLQILPELAGREKITTRLHPRAAAGLAADQSKLGGKILWPGEEAWPICDKSGISFQTSAAGVVFDQKESPHNDYYVPILQLRAEDFPQMQFPAGKNLFQLLWCPHDHDYYYCPSLKAFWWDKVAITNPLQALPQPAAPDENYLPKECRLYPEQVREYPAADELPDVIFNKLSEDQADNYETALSVAPGTKLGGYINWIQWPEPKECANGHPMEHLLTIDSEEFDPGRYDRWCPLEDRPSDWATLSREAREKIDLPHGMTLGDVGCIYVLICRQCPEWPIDWIFQCS